MSERRSMADAISLSPEKLDFIHGAASANGGIPRQHVAFRLHEPDRNPPTSEKPSARRRARVTRNARTKSTLTNVTPAATPQPNLLAPVTIRLTPETADALRRICLERRLTRKMPFTQQQVVEIAIRDWLSRSDSDR